MKIKFGILTVSDSCSEGKAVDCSGPSLVQLVSSQSSFSAEIISKIVPDVQDDIEQVLRDWSDDESKAMDVILTTGGTGFSPRDITPEATKNVIEREATGITIAMMKYSLDITPMAMLSRGISGTRKATLIINLPGSVKGATEMATATLPGISHAVALLKGNSQQVQSVHVKMHGGHTCHHAHSSAHSKVDLSQVARRARESPYPMVAMSEAINIIEQESSGLNKTETVPLENSLGLVLARDVLAVGDLPPFPASIKDGYAVIAGDGAGLRQVVAQSFAGNQGKFALLQTNQCVRVTTGAAVPPGADAVVQVEDTQLVKEADEGRTELEINILTTPTIGQDIREVGSDMQKGQLVVSRDTLLQPAHIGLIAAAGVSSILVYKSPRIAVLSTGDEVQDANSGSPLPGCIYDSNRPMLMALFKQRGYHVVDMGIIRDEPGLVMNQLREALSKAEVIVTSGGVSMGERDYLKQVLTQDLAAQIHFGRVEMKPGKPTTFATLYLEGEKKLLFALPGNPVSAAVTCHLFTLPALKLLAGNPNSQPISITARLGSDVQLDARPEYCRAVLEWPTPPSQELPTAHLTGKQISSRLLSMHTASSLLVLPPSTQQLKQLTKGALVSAILLNTT